MDEPVRWDNPVPLILARGWCVAEGSKQIAGITVRTPEGTWPGVFGLPRPDVAAALKDAPGAACSGFALRFPRPNGAGSWVQIDIILADDSLHTLFRHDMV